MPGLFDIEPVDRDETVIVIPVTVEQLAMQFIHRWGYNTTAQERMRPELDELIALARKQREVSPHRKERD